MPIAGRGRRLPSEKSRAQRLPASKRFSPGRLRRRASSSFPVLNAFRHQSGSHLPDDIVVTDYPGCSTPSGIKAVLTPPLPLCPGVRRLVLNAFRHQSGSHCKLRHAAASFRAHGCSTPSGIKAVLTACWAKAGTVCGSAQRLPASKRFSPMNRECRGESGTACAQRLPASKRFSPVSSPRSAWWTCAQRLPASKRFSPRSRRRRSAGLRGAQRLPASKRFSRQATEIVDEIIECSTPSGIKAVLTSTSTPSFSTTRRAQRLPASKRFSPMMSDS